MKIFFLILIIADFVTSLHTPIVKFQKLSTCLICYVDESPAAMLYMNKHENKATKFLYLRKMEGHFAKMRHKVYQEYKNPILSDLPETERYAFLNKY